MSESILRALMQLFAIIAKVDGITSSSRGIVRSFLKQLLNQELVEQYSLLFDEYVEIHHQITKRKDGMAKHTSLTSVKVLRICTEINAELTQKQKVVVFIRLFEFINSDKQTSEQEVEFVKTVSEIFNIPTVEFERCKAFIQNVEQDIPDTQQTLIIDNNLQTTLKEAKHIYSENLNRQIRVLYMPSVNIYALWYFGDNELYLNGQVISKNKIYILTQGSSIRSSRVQPIYYSDIISAFLDTDASNRISFEARNLDYKFKNGQQGLKGINIIEESGKLIGIMGGSGAGKSTLINVLNGIETPLKGEVLINGINIHTNKDEIKSVIGHVSQDDLLIEELTVYQNLLYNARLCFGDLSDTEIIRKVLHLLNNLGLYESKDLKVGSPLEKTISGGQRKRLNIALELIREPSVLFVDEPTSGLSSRDSENIMDLLKELALKGKLIFVVIHQPSSEIFKMFDKLLILDVGGLPIYYGNPVDAIIYFKKKIHHINSHVSECLECGNVNPEQIFNIIESKVLDEYGNLTQHRKIAPHEWNSYYKEKIESKFEKQLSYTEIPKSIFTIPNKLTQFKIFVTRDVKAKLTNTQYLVINLLEAPVLAFILAYLIKFYTTDVSNKTGYVFRENTNITAYLFMAVVVALFIGLTVSAEEIFRDRKILKRESFLNLSKISYLLSKVTVLFSLSAIQTLLFILVGNQVLEIKGMAMDYWLILFSVSCFANILGLNISSGFNSAITIYILIPFLIIPQLLLSGVIVKFQKLNPAFTSQKEVPFAGEIMVSRWAFEALAVNQFKANRYEKKFYTLDKRVSYADFKKSFWLPRMRTKVDFCENNLNNPKAKQEVSDNLMLIRNEITKETRRNKQIPFNGMDRLTSSTLSLSLIAELRDYFTKLNKFYIRLSNENIEAKDRIIEQLTSTEEQKTAFLKLKNDYLNENLSDLVKNSNELDKILEKNGELIQHADPIYLDPEQNLRSHFFAPRKKVAGVYYDTFWYNISVIWIMSFMLFILLYFDVLKKIITWQNELSTYKLTRRKWWAIFSRKVKIF